MNDIPIDWNGHYDFANGHLKLVINEHYVSTSVSLVVRRPGPSVTARL